MINRKYEFPKIGIRDGLFRIRIDIGQYISEEIALNQEFQEYVSRVRGISQNYNSSVYVKYKDLDHKIALWFYDNEINSETIETHKFARHI